MWWLILSTSSAQPQPGVRLNCNLTSVLKVYWTIELHRQPRLLQPTCVPRTGAEVTRPETAASQGKRGKQSQRSRTGKHLTIKLDCCIGRRIQKRNRLKAEENV